MSTHESAVASRYMAIMAWNLRDLQPLARRRQRLAEAEAELLRELTRESNAVSVYWRTPARKQPARNCGPHIDPDAWLCLQNDVRRQQRRKAA